MGQNTKQRDYKHEAKLRKERNEKKQKEVAELKAKLQSLENSNAGSGMEVDNCGSIDVLLSQIISDPNQPRKFFDIPKLIELSKTIIQHGVIEPILIRPIAGGLYMIVFGERRFRASLMAAEAGNAITHIPAMIKEMTDEQALEMQLVENLQRVDPHPIEDAFTFKKMKETQSLEEIALRVGKSTKFVAMRIMLCDLLPAFQEIFFANKMSLGQAVSLCKISQEAQAAIFENRVNKNWKEDEDFHLGNIEHFVDREQKNLDKAPFPTEDCELYHEAGKCSTCKFNSVNNLVLFTDENVQPVCGNSVCYNIKSERAYKQRVEEVMADPSVVFVAAGHYADADKEKVKDVEKLGCKVLPAGSWKRVEDVQKPDWEKHVEKCAYDFNEGDDVEQFDKEVKEEYDDLLEEYEQEKQALEAARKEGKIRKAFVVVGNGEGTFVEIMPTSTQGEMMLADMAENNAIENEIAEIEKREERAKELDAEKIWASVREAFLGSNHLEHGGEFTTAEYVASAVAIYNVIGWEAQKEFASDVLKVKDYDDVKRMIKAFEKITVEQYNQLCRILIKKQLFPKEGSNTSSYTAHMGYSVAKSYMPNQVADIEANQKVKAVKRAENVKKKIEELRNPKPPKEKKGE